MRQNFSAFTTYVLHSAVTRIMRATWKWQVFSCRPFHWHKWRTRFTDEHALNYCTYRLLDKSSQCDRTVANNIAKWGKRVQAQMRSDMFHEINLISGISLLFSFKLAKGTNRTHKSAAMWLLHLFRNGSSVAALMSETDFIVDYANGEGGNIEHLPEVAKYLLQTYATDNFIAVTDASFTRYSQPCIMSPAHYVEAMITKSPRCGDVHDHYDLKVIFIEVDHESVHHSTRSSRNKQSRSALYDLARPGTSLRAHRRELMSI